MSDFAEQFNRDLAEICWKDLRIHLQRDAIILVAPELDLVTTATAVAMDDKGQIEAWIATGNIAKPSREQIELWEGNLEKPFRMLILKPYILIQAVNHA